MLNFYFLGNCSEPGLSASAADNDEKSLDLGTAILLIKKKKKLKNNKILKRLTLAKHEHNHHQRYLMQTTNRGKHRTDIHKPNQSLK